jgi:large subunit ribosomal protein L22
MKIEASLRNYRRSASKAREIVRVIKGMDVAKALMQLQFVEKKDAPILKKLLLSAVANAENNFNIDKETLFVKEIVVGEGATMKRWMPRAHGRAFKILKRTCHLKVVLDQQVKETVKVDDKVAAKKDEKKKGLKGSKRKDNVTVKKTAGDNSAAKEKIVKE